jgi:hypothetical protein
LKGIGVQRDIGRGAALVVTACDHGAPFACVDAGVALYDGNGVDQDRDHAQKALHAGCHGANPGACDLERRLYGTGGFCGADAPTGAVGVTFGTALREVETKCRSAGHAWKGDAEGGYCDGPISSSVAFPFMINACEGRACSVHVLDFLASLPPSSWLQEYAAVEKQLEANWGTAQERVARLPQACANAAELPKCVASKDVVYRSTWIWERGAGVVLELDNDKIGPRVHIGYLSAAKRRPDGL